MGKGDFDRISRINRMKKGRARTEGTENTEEEAWKGLGLDDAGGWSNLALKYSPGVTGDWAELCDFGI
jgi:hypothetical protein